MRLLLTAAALAACLLTPPTAVASRPAAGSGSSTPASTSPPPASIAAPGRLADNLAALNAFSWKSRSEVFLRDRQERVMLELDHFAAGGRLERMSIGGHDAEGGHSGPGRRSRRPGERRQRELEEELLTLVKDYLYPSPRHLELLRRRGREVTPAEGGRSGVTIADWIETGDLVSWLFDSTGKRPRLMRFSTRLSGGEAVDAEVTLTTVAPAGPAGPTLAVIQVPQRRLRIEIHNFDHWKVGG